MGHIVLFEYLLEPKRRVFLRPAGSTVILVSGCLYVDRLGLGSKLKGSPGAHASLDGLVVEDDYLLDLGTFSNDLLVHHEIVDVRQK